MARFSPSLLCSFLVAGILGVSSFSHASPLVDKVDWPEMLAEHDLVWGKLPTFWDQAPFLGNGEQGTMMYKLNSKTLRWDVGCSAAHDHRPFEKDDLSEKHVEVLNRGRHFIGHLRLGLPEELTGGQSRLSLWDAEATGTLSSANGKASWRTLVHATEPVMKFEVMASGNLKDANFSYVAEKARSPRAVRAKTLRDPANPDPVLTTHPDGVKTAVHNLWAGGQTAVAYIEKEEEGTKSLWLSVQHSYPGKEAEADAVKAVKAAAAGDQDEWVKSHREWWHQYYPQSFVSTGDGYWDTFYWIQQYKLACATRDKGWIIDNQGPWLQPTAWSATWWNLNVQLSHAGVYKANRRGMGSALSHRLDLNRENLRLNIAEEYREGSYAIGRTASGWDLLGHVGQPGKREPMDNNIGRECGNLLWALHNVDLEYRYWQDTKLRDEVLYPLLVGAVNYYRHFLVEGSDGLLHLPSTHSPEFRNVEDCSYDLDLLRWGNGRLLELAGEKGLTSSDEPLILKWKDIEKRLVPTHVNETGRMLGKNAPLNGGHRHWSHLLAIYPLRTLTPETEADRELIDRSLKRWHSFGRGVAGYAFTGASCMASILGDGDGALKYLNTLKSYLKPSTMYSEIKLPVMETPLHGATAIQEMLFQSWGGRLRVFPSVPSAWTDVQFSKLRGEGAFLVTARWEKGATKWVFVESEVGGVVQVEPQISDADWVSTDEAKVSIVSLGVYRIETRPGEMVMFWPKGEARPEMRVESVPRRGAAHRFGLPKGYRK
ncbi:glycosyl hydrolase family 95 catalytic domain-containing protein [Haloferula sp.]|uniref:glycosyl hydrolase family 95 catalytic domain-containing protein n=1 Tax=Haloferula sp. TaxID=2497595 RepID=UPI0032A0BF35